MDNKAKKHRHKGAAKYVAGIALFAVVAAAAALLCAVTLTPAAVEWAKGLPAVGAMVGAGWLIYVALSALVVSAAAAVILSVLLGRLSGREKRRRDRELMAYAREQASVETAMWRDEGEML